MSKKQRVEYRHLETGYEFPPVNFKLDTAIVATYLKAVENTSSLYQDTEIPPMAVAASSMATLSESIRLPSGAIHVSQELEFINTVSVNDTLTNHATVSRKQSRGKFHLLTIALTVSNQKQKTALAGKASFLLPE